MSVDFITPDETPGSEAAASPTHFRIFIAAINTKGKLVYTEQDTENGAFGGKFIELTDGKYDPSTLQASTTKDGHVALLAQEQQKKTNHLSYIAEKQQSDNGDRFDHPVNLGLPSSITAFQDTKLIRGLDGLDNVFGTSTEDDPSIWWKFRNPDTTKTITESVIPPGTDQAVNITVEVAAPPEEAWSDWIQIPGSLKTITATDDASGRLMIAGLNSDATPYINVQTGIDPFSLNGWKGWQDIGGSLGKVDQIKLAIDGNALVHIFARVGSNIYMRSQTNVSEDTFTDWMLFAAFDKPVQNIAVATYSNDGLYLTAQVGNGHGSPIYGTHQTGPELTHWTTPTIIAFAQRDYQLMLQPNADTQLSLFALDKKDQVLEYTNQLAPDFWQAGWQGLGQGILRIAVTGDITPSVA